MEESKLTLQSRRRIYRSVRRGEAVEDPRLARRARDHAAARAAASGLRWGWLIGATGGAMLIVLGLLSTSSPLRLAMLVVGGLDVCVMTFNYLRYPTATERARQALKANENLLRRQADGERGP